LWERVRVRGFRMNESRRQVALARKLRQSYTDAEKALWARLRNKQLEGVKFRRQQPLGAYIVDFVSNERGYQVLRFWNNEVLVNMEGVLEKIREVFM
jgi:very-short-patch-repair endonuclease